MPRVVYALDNAISRFFAESGTSASRSQCDEYAGRTCGGQIRPVDLQGVTSYTVIAGPSGDKIIQFREQSALLDIGMLALAKAIHQDVVPECRELGTIGDPNGSQLVIYEMNRLPGQNYVIARQSFDHKQRLNTINSLASFFARSWQSGMPKESYMVDMSTIGADCEARLKILADDLPDRFLPAIVEAQANLPALLDGNHPVVLTHGDLNAMNILVDSHGEVTGIVDWPEASFQRFGFALYALENALGVMGPDGWKWFDNADILREAFWRAFREQTGLSEPQTGRIKLAGQVGILIRYGCAFDDGFTGMIGVRVPNAEDFRYLDALLR